MAQHRQVGGSAPVAGAPRAELMRAPMPASMPRMMPSMGGGLLNLDLILDSSLIPSLPDMSSLAHSDLMSGHPRLPVHPTPTGLTHLKRHSLSNPSVPLGEARGEPEPAGEWQVGSTIDTKRLQGLDMGTAKDLLKDLSNDADRPLHRVPPVTNGIAPGGRSEIAKQAAVTRRAGVRKHSRTSSDTTPEVFAERVRKPASGRAPQQPSTSPADEAHTNSTHHTRSKPIPTHAPTSISPRPPHPSSAGQNARSLEVPPPRSKTHPPAATRRPHGPRLGVDQTLSGLPAGTVQLRPSSENVMLIATITSLVPPARLDTTPASETALLCPSILLAPLTLILEALVVEREVLKSTYSTSSPRLPLLADGQSLQLSHPSSGGEIDWHAAHTYVSAVGEVLLLLLSVLDNEPNAAGQKLRASVKIYVSKMKKVFSEVAGMYVEGYGFVRGWWDESGMKGAAGEIGKWGEVMDV